jgi:putative MFS transporter
MIGMEGERMNIAGRMERLPLSRFQVLACVVIGLAMFFDGYDLGLTGLIIPALVKTGLLPEAQRSWFISIPLIAAAAGSALSGVIGDRFGRRRLFMANVVLYGIASPLCGLAQGYGMLLVLRTLTMFALGMQIPAGYSYLSELSPRRSRGRFQSLIALLVNGALPVGATIAWALQAHLPPEVGWRVLFGLSGAVLLVVLVPRAVLPESPRWLASAGQFERADLTLRVIEQRLLRLGVVLAAAETLPAPARDLGWATLFSRGIRRRFGLAVLFQICHLSAIFVLISWLPTIMISRGIAAGDASVYAAVSFAGGIVGPGVAIMLSDHFERRWMLAGAAAVAAAMGLIYPLQTGSKMIMAVGLVLTCTMYFISAVGYGTYIPEILPTGVRLRGMGTAALVGRITSALTPFVVSAALVRWGDPFVVVVGVGLLYVVLAPAFALLGPNTRGRSLEMLEHSGLEEADDARAYPPYKHMTGRGTK